MLKNLRFKLLVTVVLVGFGLSACVPASNLAISGGLKIPASGYAGMPEKNSVEDQAEVPVTGAPIAEDSAVQELVVPDQSARHGGMSSMRHANDDYFTYYVNDEMLNPPGTRPDNGGDSSPGPKKSNAVNDQPDSDTGSEAPESQDDQNQDDEKDKDKDKGKDKDKDKGKGKGKDKGKK